MPVEIPKVGDPKSLDPDRLSRGLDIFVLAALNPRDASPDLRNGENPFEIAHLLRRRVGTWDVLINLLLKDIAHPAPAHPVPFGDLGDAKALGPEGSHLGDPTLIVKPSKV
jgi:hypothetical protein